MNTFVKDPQAVLDYLIDWSAYLETDTITSSTFAVTSGITIESTIFTPTTATVWLSGGVLGTSYNVTNTITTTGGRRDERSFTIYVETK